MLRLLGAIGLLAILPANVCAQAMTLQDAVRQAIHRDLTVQQKTVALAQARSALAKQTALTYPAVNGSLQNFYQKSSNYGGSYALIGIAPQSVFSQNTAQINTQYTLTTGGLSLLQLAAQQALVDQAANDLKAAQNTVATTVTASFFAIAQKAALVTIDRSDLTYQHILFLNAQAKERAGFAAGVDVLRAQVADEKKPFHADRRSSRRPRCPRIARASNRRSDLNQLCDTESHPNPAAPARHARYASYHRASFTAGYSSRASRRA